MSTRVIGTLAIAVSVAAAAYAMNVTTDYDHTAQFGMYKTYAWTTGSPSPVSLTEQRIHAGVDQQLQAKGLVLAQDAPNLYVATHVVTQNVPEVIANGFGPWWGGGLGSATVQTAYVQGTLIVDLYDASSRKMVWRGVATDSLSGKPSKNADKIQKALAKMFERYPPSFN